MCFENNTCSNADISSNILILEGWLEMLSNDERCDVWAFRAPDRDGES